MKKAKKTFYVLLSAHSFFETIVHSTECRRFDFPFFPYC